MRTRGRTRLIAAGVAASAVAVLSAAPATAQELDVNMDFEIDKLEGAPGDEVHGQVDVADVAEVCPSGPEDMQPSFSAVNETANSIREDYRPNDDPYVEVGYDAIQLLPLIIASDPDFGQLAYEQSFVMTFADIETQAPVGERVNFDPAVGEGRVVVPDIEPGQWAVAATCVLPVADEATVRSAIDQAAQTMEDAGYLDDEVVPPADRFAWLEDNAANLLLPLMVPEGLGVQIFCIQGPDGASCADDPGGTDGPDGPGDNGDGSDSPGGPSDNGDGSDGNGDSGDGSTTTPPAATPVVGRPSFTG